MKLQTGTSFLAWNGVLACNSAFGMQYHLTVRVYTRWRHPGLSFVNETSPTIRWLKMEKEKKEKKEKKKEKKEENCHVLTTARRTDEGRGKKIANSGLHNFLPLTHANHSDQLISL